MSLLPRELMDLADSGPVVIVGSADASRVPELSRAWGVQLIAESDDVVLCVPSASARRVLANLESTGRIAVTITNPRTYRSFQLKGRVIAITLASASDRERVAAHQEAFVESVAAIGLPRESTRRFFSGEPDDDDDEDAAAGLMAVRVHVEALFDQTPGPAAGARL